MIEQLQTIPNDLINDHRYHFLTGDINFKTYGGAWYKLDGPNDYAIIELHNLETDINDTTSSKYLITESCIDLNTITLPTLTSALKCYGLTIESPNITLQTVIEALHSYGGYTTDHLYTNNYLKGLAYFGLTKPSHN